MVHPFFNEQAERRLRRQRNYVCTLLCFQKVVFNQYPLLVDINMAFFCLAVVMLRFSYFKMTARLIMFQVYSTTIINSMLMWVTWMRRFSGNANFFFFQTVVANIVLDVVIIQIYDSMNRKNFKYFHEIKKIRDKGLALTPEATQQAAQESGSGVERDEVASGQERHGDGGERKKEK